MVLKQVEGDLIIYISAYAAQDKDPGLVWNDMTQCFSAPASTAIIDKNCFSAILHSGQKPGDIAHVHTASFYPINMFSQVITLAKGSTDARYCALDRLC